MNTTARAAVDLKTRHWLFPAAPRWFVISDWTVRVALAVGLVLLALEARYAADYGAAAQPVPLLSTHLQALLEQQGSFVYPVCYMLAAALLLPSLYIRLIGVFGVAIFVASGAAQSVCGCAKNPDSYASLAVVGAPAGFSLAGNRQELWPLENFEPDQELVAEKHAEERVTEVMTMAQKNFRYILKNEAPTAFKMVHEAEVGKLPTIEQVRKAYPQMSDAPAVRIVPADKKTPPGSTNGGGN